MPLTGVGGYVTGTPRIATFFPARERMSQIGRPSRIVALTGTSSNDEPSCWRNSKTPCAPGFFPVWKVTQAGAVTGGKIDRRGPLTPRPMSAARFGSTPSAHHGPMRSNVAPSRPITRTRFGLTLASDVTPPSLSRARGARRRLARGALRGSSRAPAPGDREEKSERQARQAQPRADRERRRMESHLHLVGTGRKRHGAERVVRDQDRRRPPVDPGLPSRVPVVGDDESAPRSLCADDDALRLVVD